jgi:hypothetical protein
MTPITAFVALPARREPRFRRRIGARLAGIPVKERVRICNDGTADSRRRRACQDLETFLSVIYTACPRLKRSSGKS